MQAGVTSANILYVYDNVIKSPDAYILKMAGSKYASKLENFMYLDLPNSTTLETLTARLLDRTVKNPIEWLAKKSFDYDKIYNQLKTKSVRCYEDSIYLRSFDAIRAFLKSYCIGNIYIWNDNPDDRQMYDLAGLMDEAKGKVQYVTSPDLRKAIDAIGNLNIVYDWDIERVRDIVSTGLYDNILFAVADYPFNFERENPTLLKYKMLDYENVRTFSVDSNKDLPYYG